ncbi:MULTISPECIES: amino acid permease [Amycolatopsis]|uniref:Amino acid permease n=1 Tax=Amycolatopsis albidoflavus TaxID=102226 RepID=A0ABW5I826_9PSEU
MDPIENNQIDQESGLATTLHSRHITMIAFGGAIGAGIFVGAGTEISRIGPAVALGYLVVGALAAIAMRLLSVQTRLNPDSGAFATHVGDAFGHIGRFAVGWMYWWLMAATTSVECIAAADIAHGWLPSLPAWAWSVLFFCTLTAVNLAPVRVFGEFQFWLVLFKVATVVAVPVLALLAALGVLPGIHSPGMRNIVDNGGLMPRGWGSLFPGILLAAFAFVGIEMTAVASAEARRPGRDMERSTRIVTYAVAVFYVLALLMTVVLIPWHDPTVAKSPFEALLKALHVPAAATVIDIVVFTALLSVANSCIYAASRISHALAKQHDAPKSWAQLSTTRVPAAAIGATASVGLVITLFGYFAPDALFTALIDSSGAVILMVWIGIALSYLRLRAKSRTRFRAEPRHSSRRLELAAWIVSVATATMLIGMIFVDDTQLDLIMTVVLVSVIFLIVLWRETNQSADPEW